MALKIYKLEDGNFKEISSGDYSNAIEVVAPPGKKASIVKLYLRNDDETKYYNEMILRPCTRTGSALPDSNAIKIKLYSSDKQPTESQWAVVMPNADSSISNNNMMPWRNIPEVGSVDESDTTYHPFWMRVEVPMSAPLDLSLLGLSLTSTEHLRG